MNFSSPTERNDIPIKTDWTNRPWTISPGFPAAAEKTAAATVREEDVWIIGQLKTGSTWMEDVAWLITHDFDFETFKNVPTHIRTSFTFE